MKQLQGFVRRAAALVLAAVLCLCAPAALAADDAAVSGGAVTMGGANTTLIPAEEENCLSWLFGSGDTITLPYLNIRGQGLKKNVTLNLVDCLVGQRGLQHPDRRVRHLFQPRCLGHRGALSAERGKPL